MNVLFLTMGRVDINRRGIYNDLLRKFRDDGHKVYIVRPIERIEGKPTSLTEDNGVFTLQVKTLNLQKTNVIEKGLGQVSLETLYKRAIKKFFKGVSFDLILYTTPPITFPNVIEYAKKINPKAVTYLLLKDIFPQNAVDMGMMSKSGVKGLLYKFFRNKEKKLYALSDYIGCMSPANVKYVLEHNPEVDSSRVEVNPNSVELVDDYSLFDRNEILNKYNLPTDKPIFIYGGNLGKPQGIPFFIDCLNANKDREDCHFLVVGNGTEYSKIENWVKATNPKSVTLFARLPKEDYDLLVRACNVGLIFLDYRFTIPNFPSRLIPYLESRMPVICATDVVCDMGYIAEENGFGYWMPSNDVSAFTKIVDKMIDSDMNSMGEKGFEFLKKNYQMITTYNLIMNHIK